MEDGCIVGEAPGWQMNQGGAVHFEFPMCCLSCLHTYVFGFLSFLSTVAPQKSPTTSP